MIETIGIIGVVIGVVVGFVQLYDRFKRKKIDSSDTIIEDDHINKKVLIDKKDSSSDKQILLSPKVSDLIYTGEPGIWDDIVECYKNEAKKDELTPEERLTLVISYDIARIRKIQYSSNNTLFIDSSWLSHNYSFWNTNVEMQRWLKSMGIVSFKRARLGKKTSRVFYWCPEDIKELSTLDAITKTINDNLKNGISVFLVEPKYWDNIFDIQIFSKIDGMFSDDFGIFSVKSLKGVSDLEIGLNRYDEINKLASQSDAIFIDLNTSPIDVMKIVISKCKYLKTI